MSPESQAQGLEAVSPGAIWQGLDMEYRRKAQCRLLYSLAV